MTATRESTVAHLHRYREEHGRWPTMTELFTYVPDRMRPHISGRIDALVRGGHITIDASTGRITRSTGTSPREVMK